ncbi:MAG: Uma2 family endonuclease [Pyrinomonadaceae bacterium]
MDWSEVIAHPSLQDLPFKIELNEYGEVVMTPTRLKHSAYQFKIGSLMQMMRHEGMTLTECAIKTRRGTKVADVAWFSFERWHGVKDELDSPIAPEVCVEILSASNTTFEMKEKRRLYFAHGAHEVWICDEYGEVSFYNSKRKLKKSTLFPEFPSKVEI